MTSPLWRLSGVVGIAAAAVLALGSLAMASTTSSQEGTIAITEVSATTGTATWTWGSLDVGEYVSVYAFSKSSPSDIIPLPAYNGDVTTQGEYTTSTITLPSHDTWSNTGIEMQEANFAVGQVPEVPWAAGIPLILVLPWAFSAWRHHAQN